MEEFKKKFVSPEFVAEYERLSGLNFEMTDDLKIKVVPKGIIHPFMVYDHANLWQKPAWGGVTDENLNYIEESGFINVNVNTNNKIIKRMHGFNPNYDFENVKYCDETVIYIGKMEDAWGHFMHEAITRLWYVVENPDLDYRLAYVSDVKDTLLDYIYLLGVPPDRLIRINEPIKFKEVIVPDVSCRLNDYFHKKYKKVIDKMSEGIPEGPYKKIYLSRDLLTKPGGNIGGKDIESVFVQNGYTKIYPEVLSAKEKISIMKGADIVVTPQGSGTYNLLFSKDGTKLINLNTSSCLCFLVFPIHFVDLDLYYVDVYNNPLPVHNGVGPLMLSLTPYLEEFFNYFDMKFDKEVFAKKIPEYTLEFYKYWVLNYRHKTNAQLLHDFYPNVNVEQALQQLINLFNALSAPKSSV